MFKFNKISIIASSLAFLFSMNAFAQNQKVDLATEKVIVQSLSKAIPNLPVINEILQTPLKGIFEVRHSGNELFYVNEDASYLIQGNLIDTKNQKNITQDKLAKLNSVDFKTLPVKDAIKFVKGNGKRKIAVFEDPNCGYCKQFEKEIQKLENVTAYVYLYPVLGADSFMKSNNIWCSKNREKTWSDWMLNSTPIPETKCNDAPLERNLKIGKQNKITGTPTIIFEDGTKIPGLMNATQIEDKFKSIK